MENIDVLSSVSGRILPTIQNNVCSLVLYKAGVLGMYFNLEVFSH